jgi:hypothetical protein
LAGFRIALRLLLEDEITPQNVDALQDELHMRGIQPSVLLNRTVVRQRL